MSTFLVLSLSENLDFWPHVGIPVLCLVYTLLGHEKWNIYYGCYIYIISCLDVYNLM